MSFTGMHVQGPRRWIGAAWIAAGRRGVVVSVGQLRVWFDGETLVIRVIT